MVLIHFLYDLTEMYRLISWTWPPFFLILKNWGGTVFVLISGICAALGKRNLRRGSIVLGCALAVSLVTWMAGTPVLFGVLHCLGLCMVLWSAFSHVSSPGLCLFVAVALALGSIFSRIRISSGCWFWLGLISDGFASADYFPLLPNLGFFLLGAVLGRKYYSSKKTLLPRINAQALPLRFLQFCGRHSLSVYLLHQPLILGILACF